MSSKKLPPPRAKSAMPLKYITNASPFEIIPSEVTFPDIVANQLYEITVLLRNLTKVPRRIRISQPKTTRFRCDYDMQGVVAAGLSLRLIIYFESATVGQFHDVIRLSSDENYEFELRIHAMPPLPKLKFEKNINFGFCKLNLPVEKTLRFKNEGTSAGKVELRTSDKLKHVRPEPSVFTINPSQEIDVKVIYTPKEGGILRGMLEVLVDGVLFQANIEISATSVEFNRFIINESGAKTDSFNFGSLYFGQEREIKAFLVNNTPSFYHFKTKFRLGIISEENNLATLQTPNEVGYEQTERIVTCYPSEGTINCYSQIPITFRCKSKVTDLIEYETRKFAKKDENDNFTPMPEKDFEYTTYFEFDEDKNDPIILFFNAKGICPQIKISQSTLDFQDCAMNERRDILLKIENKNEEIPLDFLFEKIPHFFVKPEKGVFSPHQISSYVLSFAPKTLGHYSEILNLFLMNKSYRIPLILKGSSSTISEKIVKNRGPEGVPMDFEYTKHFLDENKTSDKFSKKRKGDRLIISTQDSQNPFQIKENETENEEKFDKLVAQQVNKNKYNQFLKSTRLSRLERVKTANLKTRISEVTEKRKVLGLLPKPEEEEKEGLPPQDYEFIFGMATTNLEPEKIPLPTNKDVLFVNKPLDKYEPVMSIQAELFNPDPNQRIKKKFPSVAKSHAEIRDCNQELTGQMLQKIYAGPVEINFGNIYVKSTETKTFSVRNDLRSSIIVRLLIENEELKDSYSLSQVIPSSQTAGFEVVFCSKAIQQFKGIVRYFINEKHPPFEFKVVAQVDPVKLELNTKTLEFNFADDNLDMEKSLPMRITNKGNSTGKFHWIMTEQKVFTIRPQDGEVPARSFIDVMVTYKPTGNIFGNKHEEERLRMKVEDGNEELIKCNGMVKEMKCVCKQDVIDLGQIPVCKKSDNHYLTLKNIYKNTAVFQVCLDKLPPYLEITPIRDKILQDETKSLKLSFFCKEELRIDSEITIMFRGGKSLVIPFKVETVLPKVTILEDELNFGEVTTLGMSRSHRMSLVNNSNIPATLILDLRDRDDGPKEYDGVECIEIEPVKENKGETDESSVMVSLNKSLSEGASEMVSDDDEKNPENEDSKDSDEENGEKKPSTRCYKIVVGPKQTLYFNVRFCPKDVKNYQIEIPLKLKGYGKLESLSKNIICRGMKPKFLMQPQSIEFKKKIITTPDKCVASVTEITITNPDKKALNWKIDMSKLDQEKIFGISPTEGFLDAGQTNIIKAFFNPHEVGDFTRIVPLFIDNEMNEPYLELILKGVGANPKLNFDRREVILPVVPLNIVARCMFRIINDGYENMPLKCTVSKEFGPLNVETEFVDGHTLGITKNKLSVEVRFSSKAPISFTAKIEVADENGKSYFIPVSGTTDNCLLTNFPYFQRNPEKEYIFSDDETKPLMVMENNSNDSMNNSIDNKELVKNVGSNNNNFFPGSKAVSMASIKSSIAMLGYDPIPKNLLERSCDHILRWLNHNALSTPIQNFPGDMIANYGSPIFELLTFLAGKVPNFREKIDLIMKRGEKVQKLMKQYQELLLFLKQNGALLNTIRPQYLMAYADYNFFIKTQPSEFISPNSLKLSENKFTYLSMDSWITLFYQIMKIFHLSRVSLKLVKSFPGIPPDKLSFPDYCLEGSNFISSPEGILLKWLEINTEIIYPKSAKRITNISTDLRSCVSYAACIQNYVGNNCKYLINFKVAPNNEEECKINADKILNQLKEIWLQTHLNTKDLTMSSPRENILFIMHLLHTLPHYIPKAAPIVFSCVLGEEIVKNIELTNPTNKPISYWVKLEGSQDFSIERENVKLEPGSQPLKYKVKFVSRISAVQTGRITFTNKKESNSQAAALVFDLQSQITQRKSLEEHRTQSRLYKMEECRFQIKNIFTTSASEYADFQISIIHEKILPPPPPEEKKSTKKKPKKEEKKEVVPDDPTLIPAFYAMKEKIRVKRGDSTMFSVQFLPFSLETHKCYVVFCDPNVGEFQHTIVGETLLPDAIKDPIKPNFTVYVDTNHKFDIPIEFKNDFIKDARKHHEQRLSSSGRSKEKDAYFKLMQNYIAPESITFELEMVPESPYVVGPKDFTIFDPNKMAKKLSLSINKQKKGANDISSDSKVSDLSNLGANENSINTLSLSLGFKTILKDFNCLIILKNQNKSDVRVYRLMFTVHPKVVKAKLELKVPCGDEIKQDIPLVNNLDRDCNIKVTLSNPPETNGQYFSGPREFYVKKKSTNYFTVTFKPPIICKSEAKLTLHNPYTNDLMEFDLIGVGEEPLAKDHIVLNCVARKPTTHIIEIPNPYKEKPISYKVETDLINPDGPPQFNIPPGKVFKYPLSVTPLLGGLYTGSITFYEEGEKHKYYIWYTVLVNTDRPKSERVIDLNTIIRKAIAFNIEISNPLKEEVVYEAILDGEFLVGATSFNIGPRETKSYELLFVPLRPFKGKGSIAFIQEKLGELWYELNLNAEECPVIRSPTLRAELGKVEVWEVVLENPSNTDCPVYAKISNPNNFDVLPENIIIPAYDSTKVIIRYTPTDLDVNETGEITLESEGIGNWHFLVYGIGLPPTHYDTKNITGALNKDQSTTIHFKNPFKDSITVSISIDFPDDLSKDVLQLLLKKNKVTIPGLMIFQIPFSFTPKEIMEYQCNIIVHMNDKIEWKYPIRGITEALSQSTFFSFKTKARQPIFKDLKINLPGLPKDLKTQKFTFELSNFPKEYEVLLRKCLLVTEVKSILESANDELLYSVKFAPMKPFKTSCDIIIMKPSGGRWKFKIHLEATDPDEDDIINIYSPLNKTTSVSFKLTNRYKNSAPFNAYFTPDSDPEFSIMPKSGDLDGYGKEGKNFIVSFTPIEYGKSKVAKLIIETEELFWSYIVKGSFPTYKPPNILQSKLENKLDNSLADRLKHEGKKNYMMENMKKNRIQSAINYKEKQKIISKNNSNINITNIKN